VGQLVQPCFNTGGTHVRESKKEKAGMKVVKSFEMNSGDGDEV
jgi:hypothetical protein